MWDAAWKVLWYSSKKHKIWDTPLGCPFFYLAAAGVAVVAAAAAQQQNQDDDPPAVIATKTVTTHKKYLQEFFERFTAHSMVFPMPKKVRQS